MAKAIGREPQRFSEGGKRNTPSFLRVADNRVPDEEFIRGYQGCEGDDVPLWWRRDVPARLSGKERRKLLRRMVERNRRLAEQNELTAEQNRRYAEQIERDAEALAERKREREKLIRLHDEEVELLGIANELRLERELLEVRRRQQELKREQIETETAIRTEERRQKKLLLQSEREGKLRAELTEAERTLLEEERVKEALRLRYLSDLELKEAMRAEQNGAELKSYSAFDDRNVLEIKDIYYKRKAETGYRLAGVSVTVPRGGVAIVYSENVKKLQAFAELLAPEPPADCELVRGSVLLNGKAIRPGSRIVRSEEVRRSLAEKGLRAFKGKYDVRTFTTLAQDAGCDKKGVAAARAMFFSVYADLAILGDADPASLYLCRNQKVVPKGVLILTSSRVAMQKLPDVPFYKI